MTLGEAVEFFNKVKGRRIQRVEWPGEYHYFVPYELEPNTLRMIGTEVLYGVTYTNVSLHLMNGFGDHPTGGLRWKFVGDNDYYMLFSP